MDAELQVDVWLRGTDFAKTETIAGIAREPQTWTDDDVRAPQLLTEASVSRSSVDALGTRPEQASRRRRRRRPRLAEKR